MTFPRMAFGPVAGTLQLLFLVLFAVFAKYEKVVDETAGAVNALDRNYTKPEKKPITQLYPMFQDVHVMMLVGFGFLMTFLKKYGFSAVGLNMLITALCIQWAILVSGLLSFIDDSGNYTFRINLESLISADFAAATVLITFGALLGKVSPVQILIISFLEVFCFSANEYIGVHCLQATDTGGSMYVHVFGAYFGLSAARVLYDRRVADSSKEGSSYQSDLFSMIGTLFLWVYWPSFNAGLVSGDRQQRAVINTYLSLAASCLTVFAVHNMFNKKKFEMVHVQNATLAGGVAVGTVADLMILPAGAAGVGICAGLLSSIGFSFIMEPLGRLKVHDTCGVHNLHGMPGLMSGLLGILLAGVGSESMYGESLYNIYPARVPSGGDALAVMPNAVPQTVAGLGRTAGQQAGMQALALLVTLLIACLTGATSALLVKCAFWQAPDDPFEDSTWWHTPDSEHQLPSKAQDTGIVNSRTM